MKFMLTYSCSHNKKSSTQKIQVIITLEAKGFMLSMSKTEYTKCDFSATTQKEGDVRLDGQILPKKDTFRYL
jgi:hypothetical protein